jgi:virginiamycin B lyase
MMRASSLPFVLIAMLLGMPAAQAQYTAKEWPDGPSKQRFAATCDGCHDINRVRVGYTPEGWITVVQMMQNMHAPVPPEEWGAMTDYLIRNFPERKRPAAAIIDGPVKANIEMWDVPTQGSRPHDPLAARDGSIWWTGQLVNKLGRVDPKTGAIREYSLKSAFTGPHGLAEDKTGNIWFTGNNTALIGKLDPNTGLVTEYPLPDPNAKDPHTLNFDQKGILWFTVQQANMIGRLDLATGAVKEWPSPSGPKSEPYGIVFTKGALWYNESAAKPNTIVRFDPASEKFQSWAIPGGGDIVRNMDVTPDGNPVMANSLTNQVGLVEIK